MITLTRGVLFFCLTISAIAGVRVNTGNPIPKTKIITEAVTNSIPEPIQLVGINYRAIMRDLFGDGAETNTNLTKSVVTIALSLNTNISADVGVRLQTWYEILNEYWGRGEVWTYPYGQSEFVVTNINQVLDVE